MKVLVYWVVTFAAALLAWSAVWALLGAGGILSLPGSLRSGMKSVSYTPFVDTENPLAYLPSGEERIRTYSLRRVNRSIIDVHEHVNGIRDAQRLLAAMDRLGVRLTCLMASTRYTLTMDARHGYEGFLENNDSIMEIKRRWPERFAAFVTIDPRAPESLDILRDYVSHGADGVKLYLGHGASVGTGEPFHVFPLDDERMLPLWEWMEDEQLPVVLHINLTEYWDEMLRLMERFPYLRINMPHLGLHKNSAARLARLSFLLRRYPYLYADISFGHAPYHVEGFEALAKWRTRSRAFLEEHSDKLMFAADMVVAPGKEMDYVLNTLRSYRQFVELPHFRFFLMPQYTMHGMALSEDALTWIYTQSAGAWLQLDSLGRLPDRRRGKAGIGRELPPHPAIPELQPHLVPRADTGIGAPINGEALILRLGGLDGY